MVTNRVFIGFGKNTTRHHLPYVFSRKDSWYATHIFRHHMKSEE